jgi:hypothetical protein
MLRSRATFLITALTIAACIGVAGRGRAQFISHNDHSQLALDGNWQSCRDRGGEYSERVYDGRWPGMPPFELHMGPFHEFALFRGIQDDHRDHGSAENLLNPHTVELQGHQAKHTWDVAGLHLEVALAGGSREECESWYVTLVRSKNPSSH